MRSTFLTTLFCVSFLLSGQAVAKSLTSRGGGKSLPSLPTCVLQCVEASLEAGNCTSIDDLECTCTNPLFQTASQECIEADCSSTDADAAKVIEDGECLALNSSNSNSTSSGNSTSSSSSSAATASGSSGSRVDLGRVGIASVVAGIAGVLAGASLLI